MPTASVYFDESGEFLIIPFSENEIGMWTAVNGPERMQWDGSSAAELGEKVLKSLNVSRNSVGPPIDQGPDVFGLTTGAKSWRAFAKTRQMVNIDTDDGRLQVAFWRRNATLGYEGLKDDPPEWTVSLPLDASAEAVGKAVIQVLRAANVAGV